MNIYRAYENYIANYALGGALGLKQYVINGTGMQVINRTYAYDLRNFIFNIMNARINFNSSINWYIEWVRDGAHRG